MDEQAVRARLPARYVAAVDRVAGEGLTNAANFAAFARLRLRPRVLRDVSQVDTAVELLGCGLRVPVLGAPTASLWEAHPEGDLALCRAASAAGTIGVASMVSFPRYRERWAALDGAWWLQLYLPQDRGLAKAVVDAALEAGAAALCLSVDSPVLPAPGAHTLANLAGLAEWLRVTPERLLAECFGGGLTERNLSWLAAHSRVPVVAKGVLDPDDARLVVDHGAAAVIVSNHGGRTLDGAPAALDALPGVVAALGGAAPVLVDGGVRAGTDVLKALALGARATLVGRPCAWALGAAPAEVEALFRRLEVELRYAMALTGVVEVRQVTRGVLW